MPGLHRFHTDPLWLALIEQRRLLAATSLSRLFAQDASRFSALSWEAEGVFVDLSKQRWNREIVDGLVTMAERSGLAAWTDALFGGERVNVTEGRPALHTALRQQGDEPVRVAGEDVMPLVRNVRERMRRLADEIRHGRWLGATGSPIRSVINIGIGGSDLGPLLVSEALSAWRSPAIDVHFVSNVDPAHLARTVERLDPRTTLVIVTSKTFTTLETLRNAEAARDWLLAAVGAPSLTRHVMAVTASVERAVEFGVHPDNVLPFWDWVGGRYSVWSAVGLPVAIAVGWDAFARFLAGAESIDRHFRQAPPARNLPVLLALSTIWNGNFLDAAQIVLAPYAQALARFPAYVQQLSLESNGKRVDRDGERVSGPTALAFWGEPGTNAQHAFFQWLHQGTRGVPVEFIVPIDGRDDPGRQRLLVANAFAQAQALMRGKSEEEARQELEATGVAAGEAARLAPHRTFPGDRPSTTVLLPAVDPWCLGQLIAIYEHRTFVEALLWGINPFDQFGVELGKRLTPPISAALETGRLPPDLDGSTAGLIARARTMATGRS